jgi:periplasmic divalent cation tolerance protein
MYIAWTTVGSREHAEHLAADVITRCLAACVQVDGPVASHYLWQGKAERAEEFRLTFKFLPEQRSALERHVLTAHPYDTPQWIVVRAEDVAEKYLSWARANTSTPPL